MYTVVIFKSKKLLEQFLQLLVIRTKFDKCIDSYIYADNLCDFPYWSFERDLIVIINQYNKCKSSLNALFEIERYSTFIRYFSKTSIPALWIKWIPT